MKIEIDPLNLDSFDREIVRDSMLYDKLYNAIFNDKVPVAAITIIGLGGDIYITGSSSKTSNVNTLDARPNQVTFILGEIAITAAPVIENDQKYVVLSMG